MIVLIFLSGNIFSQVEDITFKVTNYEINGVNYDNQAIDGDLALSFYRCDDETLCFSNFYRAYNSQSYGSIHSLKATHYDETEKMHEIDEYQFTWKFFNTYNSNRGEAAVTLTYIYVGNTVKMTAEIVELETNEILKFKGYLEK